MPRARLLAPLLPLALVLASCGGADAPSTSADAPRSAPSSAPASKSLTVGETDLRLGGANTDDGRGERSLAGPSRPNPLHLRRYTRPREGVGAGASCPDQDLMPDAETLDRVVVSTLCLLNGERADAGLPPLEQEGRLAQAAIVHSQDMVAKSYFAHDAQDGTTSTDRIKATGYVPSDRAWTVGENLAWGTGTLATPKNIVAAWMNSQGHRENILRPAFNQIGFGVVVGNPGSADGQGATYTTTFGSLGGSAGTTPVAAGGGTTVAPQSAAPAKKVVKQRSARRAKKSKRARAAARKRARAAKARAARRAQAARRKG